MKSDDSLMERLKAAVSEIARQQSYILSAEFLPVEVHGLNARRDQNDVIWAETIFGGISLMSAEAYEALRDPSEPKAEDLPFWDSHDQNIVDVDEGQEVGGKVRF